MRVYLKFANSIIERYVRWLAIILPSGVCCTNFDTLNINVGEHCYTDFVFAELSGNFEAGLISDIALKHGKCVLILQ